MLYEYITTFSDRSSQKDSSELRLVMIIEYEKEIT